MKKTLTVTALLLLSAVAMAQLAAPSLSSPSDNASECYTRQTFSWSRVTGATVYELQVDTSDAFGSPLLRTLSPSQTSYSSQSCTVNDLLYGTTYHWRVRAVNGADTSGWSAVHTLTTT